MLDALSLVNPYIVHPHPRRVLQVIKLDRLEIGGHPKVEDHILIGVITRIPENRCLGQGLPWVPLK